MRSSIWPMPIRHSFRANVLVPGSRPGIARRTGFTIASDPCPTVRACASHDGHSPAGCQDQAQAETLGSQAQRIWVPPQNHRTANQVAWKMRHIRSNDTHHVSRTWAHTVGDRGSPHPRHGPIGPGHCGHTGPEGQGPVGFAPRHPVSVVSMADCSAMPMGTRHGTSWGDVISLWPGDRGGCTARGVAAKHPCNP